MTPTGLTADGTWQLGVRRTFPITPEEAWALVERVFLAEGEVRSITPGTVVRLAAAPAGSTLQVRVTPAATGTTIGIHHERLPDAETRERLLTRWTALLEDLRP
jgi:hypothetical protein